MYNFKKIVINYFKNSGILWQYLRDEPALDCNGAIIDFNADNATTDSFNIKEKITGETSNNCTKNPETMVPLKFLSNFWRAFEMCLINCEINLDLNWSKKFLIVNINRKTKTLFRLLN